MPLILTGVVALGVGGAIGGAGDSGTAAQPAPTVTVTKTANAPAATEAPADEPTEEPTEEPAGYKPKRSDWSIGLKTLKKECFGTAGCNLIVRIKPDYVGSQQLPDTGTIEVTYRIVGGEDPVENTFTVEGGSASYDKEEEVGTTSSRAKLAVKVLDVAYDG